MASGGDDSGAPRLVVLPGPRPVIPPRTRTAQAAHSTSTSPTQTPSMDPLPRAPSTGGMDWATTSLSSPFPPTFTQPGTSQAPATSISPVTHLPPDPLPSVVDVLVRLMRSWYSLDRVKAAIIRYQDPDVFAGKVRGLMRFVLPIEADQTLSHGMAFHTAMWLDYCLRAQEIHYSGLVNADLVLISTLQINNPTSVWALAHARAFTNARCYISNASLHELHTLLPANFWRRMHYP